MSVRKKEGGEGGGARGSERPKKVVRGCGIECRACGSQMTVRMDYEDRGRKAETWGSKGADDKVTIACHTCGHRWLEFD